MDQMDKLISAIERFRNDGSDNSELAAQPKTMAQLESEFLSSLENNSGSMDFSCWLPSLAGKVEPVNRGEMIGFMADTGAGKTALVQNLALLVHPLKTLFFELELPGSVTFQRFACISQNMTMRDVRQTYMDGQTVAWREDPAMGSVAVCTMSRMTPTSLKKVIFNSVKVLGEPPALVVVDYLGLMDTVGRSRYERVSAVVEELKRIAGETNTIMVVTSQIHRKQDGDIYTPVTLHDAKDSGSIENSVQMLWGLWHDEEEKDKGTVWLEIKKSNKGGRGLLVKCTLDGPTYRIREESKLARLGVDSPVTDRDKQTIKYWEDK